MVTCQVWRLGSPRHASVSKSYNEWKREFDQFVTNNNLPNLSLVRISHDHMGSFGTALGGVNTPETQQADCDLALGLMIEAVAYAKDTLIVAIEDDVQDGPDHVDSHRGKIFFAGPYVKQGGGVVNTYYSQVNLLRTIEDILGTEHINLNTAFAQPMADGFDIRSSGEWRYVAKASTVLATTTVANATNPGLRYAKGPMIRPAHDAAYGTGSPRDSIFPKPIRCQSHNSIACCGLG